MSRQFLFGCALFSLISSLPAETAWAESMRCKQRLVSPGFKAYEVTALCGPPDGVETRVERRMVRRRVRVPCGQGWCDSEINDQIELPVEVWTYDFGPQRFLQHVTIEAGVVVRIETGKYGYKPQ